MALDAPGLRPPTGQAQAAKAGHAQPQSQPLYQQVRDLVRQRIADGSWPPGMALPAEPRLAAELGVSQGTVRKALDELAAAGIVQRRQGRGTFVAAHTAERSLFHFFQLVRLDGTRPVPESRTLACARGPASEEEAARLGIPAGAQVIRIDRVRTLDGAPAIAERIVAPAALFRDLGADGEIPNTLYDLYQRRYGVTVARARERVTAVAAGAREAELLAVAEGAPLLSVDRAAEDLDGRTVEWRVSRVRTDAAAYAAELV